MKTLLVWLGAFLVLACGGGGTSSRLPEDGRVFVRNDTPQSGYPYPVSVEYLHPGETGPEPVEVTVEPGETEEVTKDVLKGGTKVTFTIIGHTPRQQPRAEVEVTIDGSITIVVTRVYSPAAYDNPRVDYYITGAPG
ncbi:MAG TPA: hypothetical protein EYP61_01320 [Candidatus Latescibacteria bacterium]|nr:hypothetical protein [Candidatus Latescibacterota bacterium]